MFSLRSSRLIVGAIFRSRLGAFTPAQVTLQVFSVVQFNRAVQPVEHEKTEGTEDSCRWERVFDVELSRFTKWRVGVGLAHRWRIRRQPPFALFPPVPSRMIAASVCSPAGRPFDDVSKIVSHTL